MERTRALRFDDGTPVRAASGVAPFGDGHVVVQDDATHAAWVREGSVVPLRVFDPVDGHEVFDEASGTKHLKPDLEAATPVGPDEVLLLGSGSTRQRMRLALLGRDGAVVRDLPDLYAEVSRQLDVDPAALNLEGACVLGDRLRWYLRGNGAAGVPNASVDLPVDALVAAVRGGPADVPVGDRRVYRLGQAEGVTLSVSDAVALPDGRVLVSVSAEDSPNAVDDGPVVASGLALLDDEQVVATVLLEEPAGEVHKVEGIWVLDHDDAGVRVLAVVDDDDPEAPSAELLLRVDWA